MVSPYGWDLPGGVQMHIRDLAEYFMAKGHEVSVHSANHPNLVMLSKTDIIYEILEDRKELERLVGYPVRGMAYPFGNTDDKVIEAMDGLGIDYARTVGDSYNFEIPEDGVECPLCNSINTRLISEFGSTACKALYQCNDCKEPFDYFKCH